MRRFELFARFSFLVFAFVSSALAFAPMALAASVGFYAAGFDPPTQAEMAIVRCAFGDASVHKECKEIGKTVSRLVVLVDESNEDTRASTRERVLMVKAALQKYRDRIEVVTASGNGEKKALSLLEDKNIKRLVRLIDADSYRAARASPFAQDPRLLWVVFSPQKRGGRAPLIDRKTLPANVKFLSEIELPQRGSSKSVQEAIQAGAATAGFIDSGVKTVIEKLGLYREVGEDLAELQRSLFKEGWGDFLRDLKLVCPGALNEKDCAELASRWDAVSIAADDRINGVDRKDSSANVLIYKRGQSEDRWAEKFTETALQYLQGSKSHDKLKPIAESMVAKIHEGYPEGKLPHLRKVLIQKKPGSMEPLKVGRQPVVCSAPRGSYNMDIDQYTADRFPSAFAGFLREQFPTRSILPADLYAHYQTVEDAYAFHRRDGFDAFYFLQTRRGHEHRDIYLAVRAKPRAYRVVFTNLRGRDQEADVFCQISHSGTFSSMRSVHAKVELPLFVFNPVGSSLKLDDKDWLLFGFKGKWEKVLLEQNWQRHALVKQGLDIDLFTHPTIEQRLVIARNVYGDDANIIMDTFYKKGARQVVYLGTAGAIADYRVGAVVTPNEFIDAHNNAVAFRKNFAHDYYAELSTQVTVHDQTKHGRVPTVYHETKELLLDWKSQSVAALDVEGFYLARFAQNHSDLRMAALFIMSDQTLGASTIEESLARLDLIDATVNKLVSFLLPKVLAQK